MQVPGGVCKTIIYSPAAHGMDGLKSGYGWKESQTIIMDSIFKESTMT